VSRFDLLLILGSGSAIVLPLTRRVVVRDVLSPTI
jgi:hypothetical protein